MFFYPCIRGKENPRIIVPGQEKKMVYFKNPKKTSVVLKLALII
jgi:hypothetical protein